jgi:hypothetical protein
MPNVLTPGNSTDAAKEGPDKTSPAVPAILDMTRFSARCMYVQAIYPTVNGLCRHDLAGYNCRRPARDDCAGLELRAVVATE